ncbi:hypothetical protein FB45DRAFT_920936 [Roridomyces roridus]|uniref:Uncharacterized protein n=1 Tax=Roridomyces roridus TaxID=1738132 RepID=A0AAD7FLT0_9AGAR|nr:hypothetical protein FB45DRAFT_920936 [Roridomyces roridus]
MKSPQNGSSTSSESCVSARLPGGVCGSSNLTTRLSKGGGLSNVSAWCGRGRGSESSGRLTAGTKEREMGSDVERRWKNRRTPDAGEALSSCGETRRRVRADMSSSSSSSSSSEMSMSHAPSDKSLDENNLFDIPDMLVWSRGERTTTVSMYDLTLRVRETGEPEDADEAQEEQEALVSSEELGVSEEPLAEVVCEEEEKAMVGEECQDTAFI